MYRRISGILFPVFGVLFAGALIWGFQANEQKENVMIQAENNYQRAFHDLSFHMDKLHAELGNALAVNSTSHGFHRKCLVNVWRLSNEAVTEIGQLPLALTEIQETEQFLSKLSSFSYQTAVRDMHRQPLSDEELTTLKQLHDRSGEIANQLQQVQSEVIAGGLRWMDFDENDSSQNPLYDGFRTVNDNVTEYDEVNWGPTMDALFEKRDFDKLEGKSESPEQIRKKVVQFFDLSDSADIEITENGEGTVYHTYSIYVENEDGTRMNMDYTRNGGQLIWFMNNRDVGPAAVSSAEAIQKADQFLQAHDFKPMKAVNYDEAGNIGHITMARVNNGVIFYPEKLTVKVALDDGETIGLQATDYIFGSREEEAPGDPGMSEEEAQAMLNPDFAVEGVQLAVIENDLKNRVLCYQFSGQINDSYYRIFLNADNGMEEKVEKIRQQSGQQT